MMKTQLKTTGIWIGSLLALMATFFLFPDLWVKGLVLVGLFAYSSFKDFKDREVSYLNCFLIWVTSFFFAGNLFDISIIASAIYSVIIGAFGFGLSRGITWLSKFVSSANGSCIEIDNIPPEEFEFASKKEGFVSGGEKVPFDRVVPSPCSTTTLICPTLNVNGVVFDAGATLILTRNSVNIVGSEENITFDWELLKSLSGQVKKIKVTGGEIWGRGDAWFLGSVAPLLGISGTGIVLFIGGVLAYAYHFILSYGFGRKADTIPMVPFLGLGVVAWLVAYFMGWTAEFFGSDPVLDVVVGLLGGK